MLSEAILDKAVKELFDNIEFKGEPKGLYDPLRYMIEIGGKRIRPRLCLLTYSLYKDTLDEGILSPASGLEIFHSFTLIHDDIMDNADIRRGVPTVYRKWDQNIAILSGDTMGLWAFRMLAKAPKEHLHKALELFSRTTVEVCEGQQLDMDFETRNDVTLKEYINMIGLKTSVLLACSAALGAVIAGADDSTCRSLYDFGYKLGIAFQIQDDWLDSFGDEKVFGKKIGGDILNNKKTWLLVKCKEIAANNGSHPQELQHLDSLLALDASEGQKKIDAVKAFYRSLDVDTLAQQAINDYYSDALDSLRNSGFSQQNVSRMEQFASTLVNRNK